MWSHVNVTFMLFLTGRVRILRYKALVTAENIQPIII